MIMDTQYIEPDIGIMVRVFTIGSGDLGSPHQVESYQRLKKE